MHCYYYFLSEGTENERKNRAFDQKAGRARIMLQVRKKVELFLLASTLWQRSLYTWTGRAIKAAAMQVRCFSGHL